LIGVSLALTGVERDADDNRFLDSVFCHSSIGYVPYSTNFVLAEYWRSYANTAAYSLTRDRRPWTVLPRSLKRSVS